jgi:amino acid transporter
MQSHLINCCVSAALYVGFDSYVGFDMIANGAEEARNPRRDIPLATALCLGLCTLLYAAASTVIAGKMLRCMCHIVVGRIAGIRCTSASSTC